MSGADRERWDRKYQDRELAGEPSVSLRRLAQYIPHAGAALDVAGGSGRNSIWLAQRGLDVTLVDVSAVGADMAQRRARQLGVSLQTAVADLDNEPLPAGRFELIVDTYFLSRPLFAQFAERLTDDGRLIMIHPTATNLQKHAKPPRGFLLDDGELPTLLERNGLEAVHYSEGWTDDGRHEAQLIARKS